jgi:hypothetical protein
VSGQLETRKLFVTLAYAEKNDVCSKKYLIAKREAALKN